MKKYTPTRFLSMSACIVLLLSVCAPFASAAEVPGFDRSVLIKTREQPVNRFVTELFGRINVPVVVAPEITGTVNGDFTGSVENVFDTVARTFFVTLYYDGSVAYVYPANELQRKILQLPKSAAEKVLANVEQMALPDSQNTLIKTDMGVVVSGSKRFHEQVAEIADVVRKSSKRSKPKAAPAPEPEPVAESDVFKVYKLRYAWAHDVVMNVGGSEITVPGVATTLRTLIDPSTGNASANSNGSQRVAKSNTVPKLKGQGLQNTAGLEDEGVGMGGTLSSRIVADSVNNAVLIRDTPDRLAMYEQLISTLDVEPKMVEIEATIIDMDTERLRELGVNWRQESSDVGVSVGDGSLAALTSAATPLGQGGILSFVLGNSSQFISRIRALETQGAARIVSKPHVMTLSNVEALLDTTSTFFVRVQGQEEVDLFDVSVGTTLRVTPHVFETPQGHQIKLLVSIEDGSASDRQVDNIPVVDTSSINTQALVNVGESLLIGGLVRERNSSSVSKVPVLGSIPGLGALFRSTQKTNSRVERLFLITPRLNLRADGSSPKRLDVPYLSGTEGELIVTAPVRMRPTQEALAARDEFHKVLPTLPAGGANVKLSAEGVPAQVNRLGLDTPETLEQPSSAPPANNDTPPAGGTQQKPSENQWQIITSTVPGPAAVPAAVAARVSNSVAVPIAKTAAEIDEWQVIQQ